MPIYCGNNRNDPKLRTGTHVLGTNYQCIKKGIGIGINLPIDNAYKQSYKPIDKRRFYCGDKKLPKKGYFAVGSPSKCLQTGIGVGKSIRANKKNKVSMRFSTKPSSTYINIKKLYNIPIILFIIISIVIFLLLYFIKPRVVLKKSTKTDEKIINWNIFIPYYFFICFCLGFILYITWGIIFIY